jgi:hypothetical protein
MAITTFVTLLCSMLAVRLCFGSELVIVGGADIESGRFMVELYAKENIADLSIFSLETEKVVVLPAVSLGKGEYTILSNKLDTEIQSFFNDVTLLVHTDGDVKLGGGDDPILLHRNEILVDAFGVDGDKYDYKHGWVRRNEGAVAPNPVYDPGDWTISLETLNSCWIDDSPSGNDNCQVPYAQKDFTREI